MKIIKRCHFCQQEITRTIKKKMQHTESKRFIGMPELDFDSIRHILIAG
jgi:hypothetical protein